MAPIATVKRKFIERVGSFCNILYRFDHVIEFKTVLTLRKLVVRQKPDGLLFRLVIRGVANTESQAAGAQPPYLPRTPPNLL